MELGDEIDALYGLPLDRFTAARNDLARRLRAEGRREDADGAAARRKPSLAAWAVNRLVREHRHEVNALLDAAATIRGGDHSADAAFRASVDRLVRASRELVAASGRKASDALLQEIATTLRALAAAAPEELVEGRLTESRQASGFADALARPASTGRSTRPTQPAQQAERKRRAAVDRERVAQARRALADARAELRARERAASAAMREAERAGTAAERAAQAVTDAEAELRGARSATR
jgi:hypothetical protein